MSQENVEFVKGLFDSTGQIGKETLLQALPTLIAEMCDPEIEWIEAPTRADQRVARGHEAVRESFERWLENFEDYEGHLEEALDCGDKVFVIAREQASGAASGAAISQRIYIVVTFREGKITRYEEFYDEQPARAAAGLSQRL